MCGSLPETLQEKLKDFGKNKALILATVGLPSVYTDLPRTPSPALMRLSFSCAAVQRAASTTIHCNGMKRDAMRCE